VNDERILDLEAVDELVGTQWRVSGVQACSRDAGNGVTIMMVLDRLVGIAHVSWP
jgi:hypothetical protein